MCCLAVFIVFKQQVQTNIKAVRSKNLFFVRKNVFWYFVLKIVPKQFSFFLLFLPFLIDFQLLCSLAVLVVSQQVLNDLNRFGRVQSKNVFYDEQFVSAAWSWQCLPFLERLKLTFSKFWTFLTDFWFLCCLAVFFASEQVWFKAFLHDFDQKSVFF